MQPTHGRPYSWYKYGLCQPHIRSLGLQVASEKVFGVGFEDPNTF